MAEAAAPSETRNRIDCRSDKVGGIIMFSVNWRGATGHVALWNGLTYREPDHDNYSTYVEPVDPRTKTYRGEFWGLI